MRSKLIITSGGSQLLTQIATCIELEISLEKVDVFYIGDKSERLKPVLVEICNAFSLNYIGELPNLRWPIELKESRRTIFYFKKKSASNNSCELKKYVLNKFPFFSEYNDAILILPLRHKMFSDILLVHGLNPSKLVLTADGVVNIPSQRSGFDKRLIGIDTPINKFPTKVPIYSPQYLCKENQKLGEVLPLKSETINAVFIKATTPYFIEIFEEIFKHKESNYVVFSQHLSLSNQCSKEEEQKYYKAIINNLRKKSNCPIVIKLHPRETEEKVKNLLNSEGEVLENVQVIPIKYGAIPVELMMGYLLDSILVTTNSSAPLAIRKGNKVICYSYSKFSDKYKKEIRDFAQLNGCKLQEL